MEPKGLTYVDVKSMNGILTNIDMPDSPENYLKWPSRGFRIDKPGTIGEKDFGTKHIFSTSSISTIGNSLVNGFLLHDPVTNADHQILVVRNDIRTRIYVDQSLDKSGNWIEILEYMTARLSTNISPDEYSFAMADIEDVAGTTTDFTGKDMAGWIALNPSAGKNNVALVTATYSSTILTFANKIRSAGFDWVAGDNIRLYKTMAGFLDWSFLLGDYYTTFPHFRWGAVEAQRKVTMCYGKINADNTITPRIPINLMKRPARNYFLTAAHVVSPQTPAVYGLTLPEMWTAELMGLTPSFAELGTFTPFHPIDESDPVQTSEVYEIDSAYPWLRIKALVVGNTPTSGHLPITCVYATIEFGSQESDPVWQIRTLAISDFWSTVKITPHINPALMPKEVTGIKFYWVRYNDAQVQALTHMVDGDSAYKYGGDLLGRITIQNGDNYSSPDLWVADPTEADGFVFSLATPKTLFTGNDGADIVSALNRAVDKVRSYPKPRYIFSAGRPQGAIRGIDVADNIVRLSVYDGGGVHNEDNFPDINTDGNNATQTLHLNGHGELYGVEFQGRDIIALFQSELELVNLTSGLQSLIPADVYSRNSIYKTNYGLVWSGVSNFYALPVGGTITPIANNLKNLIDGTLKVPGLTTPYVVDSYRKNVLCGYDFIYNEILFHMQVNKEGGGSEYLVFRFNSFDGKGTTVRKFDFNGGNPPVLWFGVQKDRSLLMGCAIGVLQYPFYQPVNPANIARCYQDGVSYTENEDGVVPESDAYFVFGSISSQFREFVIWDVLVDHKGSSVGTADKFSLHVYADRETTPFSSHKTSVDLTPVRHMISVKGSVQILGIRVTPTNGILSKLKDLALSSISIGVIPKAINGGTL